MQPFNWYHLKLVTPSSNTRLDTVRAILVHFPSRFTPPFFQTADHHVSSPISQFMILLFIKKMAAMKRISHHFLLRSTHLLPFRPIYFLLCCQNDGCCQFLPEVSSCVVALRYTLTYWKTSLVQLCLLLKLEFVPLYHIIYISIQGSPSLPAIPLLKHLLLTSALPLHLLPHSLRPFSGKIPQLFSNSPTLC